MGMKQGNGWSEIAVENSWSIDRPEDWEIVGEVGARSIREAAEAIAEGGAEAVERYDDIRRMSDRVDAFGALLRDFLSKYAGAIEGIRKELESAQRSAGEAAQSAARAADVKGAAMRSLQLAEVERLAQGRAPLWWRQRGALPALVRKVFDLRTIQGRRNVGGFNSPKADGDFCKAARRMLEGSAGR